MTNETTEELDPETAELHALYAAEKAEAQAKLKAEAETAATEAQAQSLEGLVPMKKDGKLMHAHPTLVKYHTENGWAPA